MFMVLLAACTQPPSPSAGPDTGDASTPPATPELCDNGLDDDRDGLTDCSDPDCMPCQEDCEDEVDNDLDGLADCLDPDCDVYTVCIEFDCEDGLDNDGDGLADCLDPNCSIRCDEDCGDGVDNDADGDVDCTDSECMEKAPDCVEECDDGLDNDGDGLIDCDDDHCRGLEAPCIEVCGDGLDNDRDGDTDCADAECFRDEVCAETCDDGLDNNGNGLVDCEDPVYCQWDSYCIEDCADGLDNDLDGRLDCRDPDCFRTPDCLEVCDDGIDNDLDGDVDCDDRDCASLQAPCVEVCDDGADNDLDGLVDCEDGSCSAECAESDCTDGVDNNGNGRVDCDDEECWGIEGCDDGFAIRVLSGHVTQDFVTSSIASHTWVVQSPQGVAHIGESSEHISCTWSAAGFTLRHQTWTNRTYYGATSWTGRQYWLIDSLQTSGACSGRLSSGMLSFESTASDRGALGHHMAGDYGSMNLDSTRLLGGVYFFPRSTYYGATHTWRAWSATFQIDPAMTEPLELSE